MTAREPIPRDLRAVAYLHLVLGVGSLAEFVVQLLQDRLLLAFGVLGIPIGFGLLRLSRGWRTCAVALLSIGLLLVPVAFAAGMTGSAPATIGLFGVSMGRVARGWISFLAALIFPLIVWQLRVLARPGVRDLFNPTASPADLAPPPPNAPRWERD